MPYSSTSMRRAWRAAAVTATALAAAALLAPAPARAQTVTATCAAEALGGCTALRFLFTAGAAPRALHAFTATLGAGYLFAGGPQVAFTALDDFSSGTPFGGLAEVTNGDALAADFLASPGFALELLPASQGWLEVAVAGSGAASLTFAAVDADGATTGGTAVVTPGQTVTPEPATSLLIAAGVVALAIARRDATVTSGSARR
jgi:hypothetical protein